MAEPLDFRGRTNSAPSASKTKPDTPSALHSIRAPRRPIVIALIVALAVVLLALGLHQRSNHTGATGTRDDVVRTTATVTGEGQ